MSQKFHPMYLSISNKKHVHTKTCTWMFIAAIFKRAKNCKQYKCPLTGEWMHTIWYIHAMKYYSAIKKNKLLKLATTQTKNSVLILWNIGEISGHFYNLGFSHLLCCFSQPHLIHLEGITCGSMHRHGALTGPSTSPSSPLLSPSFSLPLNVELNYSAPYSEAKW